MGFEYELLKSFAEFLGVELEIVVSNNINNLFTNLNSGRADIIAHGLAITNERKEEVLFTDYLYLTHQVLVQKNLITGKQCTGVNLRIRSFMMP